MEKSDKSVTTRAPQQGEAEMTLIIIESPYAGDIKRNETYARRAMRDALERGEHPIASHLLYTQPGILDENKPEERKRGIESGFAWWKAAAKIVFYIDYGFSKGMDAALFRAKDLEKHFEQRLIGVNPMTESQQGEKPDNSTDSRTLAADTSEGLVAENSSQAVESTVQGYVGRTEGEATPRVEPAQGETEMRSAEEWYRKWPKFSPGMEHDYPGQHEKDVLNFLRAIQQNAIATSQRTESQQGEKAEAQIEEAVTTEWKRIKPSMAAQEARSKAYLVSWDDLNIPDYVVYMMDIAAQFAIQRTEARLKECVEALSELLKHTECFYHMDNRLGEELTAQQKLNRAWIKARTALDNSKKNK